MTVARRIVLAFLLGMALAVVVAILVVASGGLDLRVGLPIRSIAVVVGAVILATFAALVVLRVVVRGFAVPARQILDAVNDVSAGDLSPALPEAAGGELGVIASAIRVMCGQMRMVLAQLDSLSARVLEATERAGGVFQDVHEGSRGQSQSVSRIREALGTLRAGLIEASREIESVSRRVHEGAAAINEMDVTITRVAEIMGGLRASIAEAIESTREDDRNVKALATDLSDLSARIASAREALGEMLAAVESARRAAHEAAGMTTRLEPETERIGQAIEAVIEGSNEVHVANERILEVTKSLESRVSRVDDVIEVILSLAERTKLLSINASIIASEAGEHGHAFAVVAHELKELAQSTAGAIAEISGVVAGLKDGFTETVSAIHKGQVDVDRGVSLARDAVVLLKTIPDQVHRAAARNAEIVTRTETQARKGQEVEEIIAKVVATLGRVSDLLTSQVSRNERTLDLFHHIDSTSDRVLTSTREHAAASGEVSRAVEKISADFRALSGLMRQHLASVGGVVEMAEDLVKITDDSRRSAEDLSTLVNELNRYAQYLGEDFRKLGTRGRTSGH